MIEQDITLRIRSELITLKREEADLNNKFKIVYHLGDGTFKLLPELERVRKRRVVLEDTLRVMEEFK
jgi:hypothetical protein